VTEIRWSLQAIADVEAIRDFISRDSSTYGALVAARIVSAIERLALFPESGRIVPEFRDPALREVLWRNYRIVYRCRLGCVEIATVFHGARLFASEGLPAPASEADQE